MKLRDFALAAKARIEAAHLQCADPLLHAKQILELGLNLESTKLYVKWEDEMAPAELARATAILERRLTGEPFQYIAGYEWFWNSRFAVGPGVLIPRRETEILVEAVLEKFPDPRSTQRVIELGPGSGNIGISVLLERPNWEWHAVEKNPATLPYLNENVGVLLKAREAFHVHPGDFFEQAKTLGVFDGVAANPPYVAARELATVSKEVACEPRLALDGGGEAGLVVIEKLAATAAEILRPGGWLVSEVGFGQAEEVCEIFIRHGFGSPTVRPDYAGIPRVVWSELPSKEI